MKISPSRLPGFLQRIWQGLSYRFTSGSELRVWQTTDHHRHCWRAYDPLTRHSACFGSEAEMRLWIEERYYLR